MKTILSLAFLLLSTAAFANDRICLVQQGAYVANIKFEFFDAATGTTNTQVGEAIPMGKVVCSKKYYPERGDIVTVSTSHMVFPGFYRDTCPTFKTNESVKVQISGTTLNFSCDVKKCDEVGCSELLELP